MPIETRLLRARLAATQATLDAQPEAPPYGSAAIVGITTTVDTYPTVAGSFFAMTPNDVSGAEVEGEAAIYEAQDAALFYAWNAGTEVPPESTPVVCHAVGGRWVFRYDLAP